jgi:V/A-type H+-transporting ATPase subunit E
VLSSRKAIEKTLQTAVNGTFEEFKSNLSMTLSKALETVSSIKNQTISESLKKVEGIRRKKETLNRQILGSADVIARNKNLELVEENVNKVLKTAINNLSKSIPPSSDYEKILTKLLNECIEIMGINEMEIQGNKRDLDLLKKVINKNSKSHPGIKFNKKPIECVGGLKASSLDNSIMYDNTFEGRLERLKPMLRREVSNLFMEV